MPKIWQGKGVERVLQRKGKVRCGGFTPSGKDSKRKGNALCLNVLKMHTKKFHKGRRRAGSKATHNVALGPASRDLDGDSASKPSCTQTAAATLTLQARPQGYDQGSRPRLH